MDRLYNEILFSKYHKVGLCEKTTKQNLVYTQLPWQPSNRVMGIKRRVFSGQFLSPWRSPAVQKKSISGLRLWGWSCADRAAATSGSRSVHWDSSWTRKPPSRETRQEDKNSEGSVECMVEKMGQCRRSGVLVTCLSWLEDRVAADVCEMVLRSSCLAWLRTWGTSTWRHSYAFRFQSKCYMFDSGQAWTERKIMPEAQSPVL